MSEREILLDGLVYRGIVPVSKLCEMLKDLVDMERSDVDALCSCRRWLITTENWYPTEIIVGGRPGKSKVETCPALIWLAQHGGKLG